MVETPLTVRDLIVSRHSSGCLAVQKVAGSNLPLEEDDWYVSYFTHIFSCTLSQMESTLFHFKLDTNGTTHSFPIDRKEVRQNEELHVLFLTGQWTGISDLIPG